MLRVALFCLSMTPAIALAAGGGGGGSTGKPTTTPTTQTCTGSQVWDASKKKCVTPQGRGSFLDDKTLGDAVRELAYAGRIEDAQGVLRAMADQESDLALTYWGFTHRKLGNMDQAMMFYDRALIQNPDNFLARSYLGQAHVVAGRMMAAKTQLREIRSRGGAGTWAEISLATAIETGNTFDY